MQSYKELIVWQKSVEFVTNLYKITQTFPKFETYGLSNQMQRAAVSIASNIAEGYQRQTRKEYLQFLFTAYGSSSEVETQLIIAKNLRYIDQQKMNELLDNITTIQKMLNALIKKLKSTS
ncbi:four helix bundle protein [Candidatus Cerribacteria bacterium 'Amazon FNV 2010 28 9']|uniref:Four helix bundle protein n=1 Tax=Candidatus Cerribacteria bacterium 'Amazon FNV 2010 28 9' TaxID=2081795 RepID=A0A317JS88_9BACT|nr:MAG: four helix bundle protein [Candidatus Cerribacteria bacterium 'Amazon FNV 2010 28 9']